MSTDTLIQTAKTNRCRLTDTRTDMGICTGMGMDTGTDIDIHTGTGTDTGTDIDIHTGTGMDTGTDTIQTFAQAHTFAEVQAQKYHRFGYMLKI